MDNLEENYFSLSEILDYRYFTQTDLFSEYNDSKNKKIFVIYLLDNLE